MKIEEIDAEKLSGITRAEVANLNYVARQIIRKYRELEKSDSYLKTNWSELVNRIEPLIAEIKKRRMKDYGLERNIEDLRKNIKTGLQAHAEREDIRRPVSGIYLVPPHGKWLWEGKKELIVKAKNFPNMVNRPLVLVSGEYAYGVIKLKPPERIDMAAFDRLGSLHLISETERINWWTGWKKEFWAYSFEIVERYEMPRKVHVKPGTQVFIQNVEFVKGVRQMTWGLAKPKYRIFEAEDLKNTKGFQEGKIVVEAKFDGVRAKLAKHNGKAIIHTDPDETATPNKTSRLPHQIRELESMKQDDFVLDAEIVMLDPSGKEVLHRTTVNALINGKFDPTERSKNAVIYAFDILEHNGSSTREWPLKERKETLSSFSSTDHIRFVTSRPVSTRTAGDRSSGERGLSYVVNAGDFATIRATIAKIMSSSPRHISEGAMIKVLEAPYSGATWSKYKAEFEVDCLVVGKKEIIREGKKSGNWTYTLAAGPISEKHAEFIRRRDSKAVIEWEGRLYNRTGRSDNSEQNVGVGTILRVSAEDINRFETENPDYPYYKTYVARVKQPVPEKKSPDSISVLERLSEMTPRRERMKKVSSRVSEDVKTSKEAGKIPEEIYGKYARENEPLPPEFYVDYHAGEAWCQSHIRGCLEEDVEAYKAGRIPFWKVIANHSIHLDLRMNFESLPKLVQYVITESDIPSYFRMLKGETVQTAGGQNVQHSLGGDTYIITKRGLRKLQYVKPGDEIIAADGQWHYVKRLIRREPETSEAMCRVTPGGGLPFNATADHRILDDANHWVEAGDLTCHKIPDIKIDPGRPPLQLYLWHGTNSLDEPNKLEVKTTPDFWRLVGFLVAEGMYNDYYARSSDIIVEVNPQKTNLEPYISVLEDSGFHYKVGKAEKKVSTGLVNCETIYQRLVIKNAGLKEFLNQEFRDLESTGSKRDKSVPLWLASLDEACFEAFWSGYCKGDERQSEAREISTTSKLIAANLYLILRLKGENVSLEIMRRKNYKDLFTIRRKIHHWQPAKVEQIRSGRRMGNKYLYDLEIDGAVSFISPNIILHNSFIVIKPSALAEPEDSIKKTGEKAEFIINEAGAKLLEEYQIFNGSYWISPGEIGATANRFAWMGLIWEGTVKGGIQRRDFKEFFLKSSTKLPEKNRALLDGRFIIKCLKRSEGSARWEIWEAVSDPRPGDAILHKDGGDWYPVKAKDVRAFGRENYSYGRKEPK